MYLPGLSKMKMDKKLTVMNVRRIIHNCEFFNAYMTALGKLGNYFALHPEKCFVESTKIWLVQQSFLFKYGSMEILFKLTTKILLIFFFSISTKNLQKENGTVN